MVDNDAGGIATYSVAGARYGYAIIWVMIPTVVLLYMVQEMNARMGVVTGKGLASLIRERFSLRLTALVMVAMMVANFANTVSKFAGIAASSEIFGIRYYLAVPVAAACDLVASCSRGATRWSRRYSCWSAWSTSAYIISAFLAKPDWAEVARGSFVPSGS